MSRVLPSLTSLRFVAALLVFGYHFRDDLAPGLAEHVDVVTRQGFTGVGFFFVLSGFVLAWSAPADDTARAFHRRRFARVYPAYLAAWLAAAAVGEGAGLDDLPSLLLLQAWWPQPDVHFGVLAVGWTLSCEAFFYALTPGILPRIGGLGPRARAVGLGVAALGPWLVALAVDVLDASAWTSTILPLSRLPEFVAGALLATHVRSGPRRVPLGGAVAFAVVAYVLASQLEEAYATALTSTGWIVLIGAVATADAAGRAVLDRMWMIRLGVLSYAFYLVHGLCIDAWARVGERTGLWQAGDVDLPEALVHVGIVVAGAVAASWVLWRAVEDPLERRLRGAPAAVASDGVFSGGGAC